MDIKTDIQKQINAGFSKEEIVQNLLNNGYSNEEVTKEYANIAAAAPESATMQAGSGSGSVSIGSILLGILFLIVAIWRFARVSNGNGGNIFLVLGIFTAIGMAIYFFTKKK